MSVTKSVQLCMKFRVIVNANMSDISDEDEASYVLPDDEVREIKRAMVRILLTLSFHVTLLLKLIVDCSLFLSANH